MKFEWDKDKNSINKEKHKISFETAAYVFEKDTIRLISARLATNAERELYYAQDIHY